MSESLLATYFDGNGDLILAGMNQDIKSGERVLNWNYATWVEDTSLTSQSGFHPYSIRLPEEFQSDLQKITCPTCHLTYTHQHVFTPGASKPRAAVS